MLSLLLVTDLCIVVFEGHSGVFGLDRSGFGGFASFTGFQAAAGEETNEHSYHKYLNISMKDVKWGELHGRAKMFPSSIFSECEYLPWTCRSLP